MMILHVDFHFFNSDFILLKDFVINLNIPDN